MLNLKSSFLREHLNSSYLERLRLIKYRFIAIFKNCKISKKNEVYFISKDGYTYESTRKDFSYFINYFDFFK